MKRRKPSRFKTWQLWHGLFSPPETSPVFQRVLRAPIPWPSFVRRFMRALQPVIRFIAPLEQVIIAICAPFLLPIAANLIGLLFAYYVASFISRERERGTYDLLALTPVGEWDASWAICLACVYRFNVLDQINFMRAMAILGIILLAFPVLAGGGLGIVLLITAGIAMQFDAIQTIVVGCLCGMLGQTYDGSASNVGMSSAALFVGVQLMVYAPVVILFSLIVFTPGLRYEDIGVAAPLAVLILLFALHEITIRLLWTALRRRLQ
jgi:hypothetical protein